MKINRESFLNTLVMVKAGLSPREFIEQSNCFVFENGRVMTFNDEVACRKKIKDINGDPLNITGAIQAASLMTILEKIPDPELMVQENDRGQLEFRGKKKAFGVIKEGEVHLPINKVEDPEKWTDLPEGFAEAIRMVQRCICLDETRFTLTCVHLHPEYMEACDNHQLMRYKINLGMKEPTLIRGTSLTQLSDLGMSKIAVTKSWVHFKNPKGLIFSSRKYNEEYPDLNALINFKGRPITIPKGVAEASERAAVFASDTAEDPLVTVKLTQGVLRLTGEGLTGWFKEVKKLNYDGPPMKFLINPALLHGIAQEYSDAEISSSKFRATKEGIWQYVTVLGKSSKAEEAEDQEASE